jgi:Tfp pilus assembly protein PilN
MTTVITEAVPAGPPVRLLALSADLLPPEIVQRRRIVRIRLIVLASIGAVLVLLAGWFALSTWQVGRQEDKLAATETEAIGLRTQQRQYSELINAQTQSTKIDNQLATLLKTDVQWATLTARLRAAAPRGLELTAVAVALTDPTTQGATGNSATTTASGLPSSDGKTPIGSLTISGTSTTKTAIASYVDAVSKVSGIGNVLLSGVTDQEDGSDFTLRADLSPTLLSHHYQAATD